MQDSLLLACMGDYLDSILIEPLRKTDTDGNENYRGLLWEAAT